MKKVEEDEMVLCVYDENGISIEQKILEVFTEYVRKHLQDTQV